jgi:hypothetical protein
MIGLCFAGAICSLNSAPLSREVHPSYAQSLYTSVITLHTSALAVCAVVGLAYLALILRPAFNAATQVCSGNAHCGSNLTGNAVGCGRG